MFGGQAAANVLRSRYRFASANSEIAAMNLRLKVTRQDGLCVVIPKDFDEKKIPPLLKRKQVWIVDAMKRVGETRRFLEPRPIKHLPESLRLTALGKTWPIVYCQRDARAGIWLRSDNETLVLSGQDLNHEAVVRKLKEWLRLQVRVSLFPVAQKLADKHHMQLRSLFVKSQRTRWASCSAQRNLSPNTKLLFLPPSLVRYVLIHELCHTVYMNHSKEFWRLVASHEAAYKVLDQALREAWKTVPDWMF
jgi:predicted metal-dependent hydrolase